MGKLDPVTIAWALIRVRRKRRQMAALHVAAFTALVVMAVPWTAFAVQNDGAERIVLKGGRRGVVLFPHHRHQNALQDCNICHSMFPQEPGGIDRLKADGTLAKKQVMKTLCIHCHRTLKRLKRPGGPTTCAKCHVKAKGKK